MQKSLALDHNSHVPIHELQSQILSYLVLHNEEKFSSYHEGNISQDTETFFRTGNYCQSIVDIIVQCAPDALKTNMYIYQKGSEDRLLIQEFLPPLYICILNTHLTVMWEIITCLLSKFLAFQ